MIKPPTERLIGDIAAVKQAASYLAALHQNRQLLLALACHYDDIRLNGPLMVFSADNPFTGKLNRVNAMLWKARGQYETGGLAAITFESLEETEPL